jgi:hypothetical protein
VVPLTYDLCVGSEGEYSRGRDCFKLSVSYQVIIFIKIIM